MTLSKQPHSAKGTGLHLITALRTIGLITTNKAIRDSDRDLLLHDARIAFRAAIHEHHVDKGGDPERCRELTQAWSRIRELLTKVPTLPKGYTKKFPELSHSERTRQWYKDLSSADKSEWNNRVRAGMKAARAKDGMKDALK